MSAFAWVVVICIIIITILWFKGDPIGAKIRELRAKYASALAYGAYQETMIAQRRSVDPIGVSMTDQARLVSLADISSRLTDRTAQIGAVVIAVDTSNDKMRDITIASSELDNILAMRDTINGGIVS